jgi:hypothetical protein
LILVLAVSWLSRGPSSEEVVEAFREDGLEVGEVYPIEKQEGPSPGVRSRLPGTYEEGTRFEIPSLGEDATGRDLGGGSSPSSPRRIWRRCATSTKALVKPGARSSPGYSPRATCWYR